MGSSLFRNIFTSLKKRSILYDTLDMYQILKDKTLPYMGYAEGLKPGLFVQDVELIKHIMIKDFDHFTDRLGMDWAHDPHMGRNLIFLKGNEWKQVRSALSPAFTTGKIKRLFKMFQATGKKLVMYINTELGQGENSRIFKTCGVNIIYKPGPLAFSQTHF